MKAKVIETGETVNVLPYPTVYQEKGQGPDRREWFEDELDFIDTASKPKTVSIDKACQWLESVNLDYYQIREGVFSKELVEDFRKAMEE